MKRHTARLIKTGFGATVADLPADIVLTPLRWSASDRGGYKDADLEASGNPESLATLGGWVGDRIEIRTASGGLAWVGILWDIEISLGNIVVSISMDGVYNRVAVIYPNVLADGSEESATTLWVEDGNSIARYGVRELLYGMPESFSSSPTAVRDQLLRRLAAPAPIVSTRPTPRYGARLSGVGAWVKASSVYFNNADGLLEHTAEAGTQVIGRYISSTAISFGTSTPGGENDEIFTGSGDFLPLDSGDSFTISGASDPDNNGTYRIDHMDAINQIAISGTFDPESAGATVKISYGEQISYDNIIQGFQVSTPWTVTRVAVKVRKLGSPGDNFRIALYPDSGGVPGTFLSAEEIAGSLLPTELSWVEFVFATPVALSAATTYYIGIRRTAAASLDSGYEVAVDEGLGYAGGTFRVLSGASWISRSPDADMPFRLIGEISSTAQIDKAIKAVSGFSITVIPVDSLIPVRQYTVGENTVAMEVDEMLEAGTAAGERLVLWVSERNIVVVDVAKPSSLSNLTLGGDGKIYHAPGRLFEPGRLIFGQYIDVDSALLLAATGVSGVKGPSIYIEGSVYDAITDRLEIIPEGAVSPWDVLKIRKG